MLLLDLFIAAGSLPHFELRDGSGRVSHLLVFLRELHQQFALTLPGEAVRDRPQAVSTASEVPRRA